MNNRKKTKQVFAAQPEGKRRVGRQRKLLEQI